MKKDIAAIATIFIIGAYTSLTSIFKIFKKDQFENIIRSFRHQFGQGILLGLEFYGRSRYYTYCSSGQSVSNPFVRNNNLQIRNRKLFIGKFVLQVFT